MKKRRLIVMILMFFLVLSFISISNAYAGDCEAGLLRCVVGVAGYTGVGISIVVCGAGYLWCKAFYK